MPRGRDPLSVGYDGEVQDYFSYLATIQPDSNGVVTMPFALRGNSGWASRASDDLGSGLTQQQRAFTRSLWYNYYQAYTPGREPGTGSRLPGDFSLHVEWTGPATGYIITAPKQLGRQYITPAPRSPARAQRRAQPRTPAQRRTQRAERRRLRQQIR